MENRGFYDKDKNTAYLRGYRGTGGRGGIISFAAVVLSATASGEVWSGQLADSFTTGEGTEGNPYQINTAEELAFMASKANAGDTNYASAYYKLTADIVLNESLDGTSNEWTAIGTDATPFTGTFDGDGHTVSGIVINKSGEDYQGLFGYSTGTIMNVGVIDSSISGGSDVGGVCGYNYYGIIENCYNIGAVIGSNVEGMHCIGGVCGYNGGTITNCYYLEGCNAEGTTFTNTEGTSKTEKQFKNGLVCYLLNGSTSINPVWYQLLETENYPNLDSTNSANRTVYQCAACTGVFSNAEGQTAEHSYVVDTNDSTKHICENCGDTHDAVFTADDETDTISVCCDLGSVTLKAPTGNLTYDGTAMAAAVEGELTGIDTPKILYKLKGSSEAAVETAPINAGTYVASITYTDAGSDNHSVSVEYTIDKATPGGDTDREINVVCGVGTFTEPVFTGVDGQPLGGEVKYSTCDYSQEVEYLKTLSEGIINNCNGFLLRFILYCTYYNIYLHFVKR